MASEPETSAERVQAFNKIYQNHDWGGESRSGNGSNVSTTVCLREDLINFCKDNNVSSILDIGCGEFNWQKHIDWAAIGVDVTAVEIVPAIVTHLKQLSCITAAYTGDFVVEVPPELLAQPAPDVVLLRNFLQHLTTEDIRRVIRNVMRLQPKFIIMNHYPDFVTENMSIDLSIHYRYRPINLFLSPYNLPRPINVFRDDSATSVWKTADIATIDWVSAPSKPTVLLAILARNKEHVLRDYLKCITDQTFPKTHTVIYIRTNNNDDGTEDILKEWIAQHYDDYKDIEFDNTPLDGQKPQHNPHEWNADRFAVLGKIRDVSLRKTLHHQCDYYFVVDCDNFITPTTLAHLVDLRRPIVAPLLQPIPDLDDCYANFWADTDEFGFYANTPEYLEIIKHGKRGCFDVPLVHCTYLIDSRVIPLLKYIDNTRDFEFIVFARSARRAGVAQFVTNECNFGTVLHADEHVTLTEEKAIFDQFKIDHDGVFYLN